MPFHYIILQVVVQLIQQRLKGNYIVMSNPATKRKGTSFSPYSRSRHDLCIMHKENRFKHCGTLTTGLVSAFTTLETEESQETDGEVVTSVIEFKTSTFSHDQLLAEMICTLTDSSVEELKRGKQINKAIIYGASINYEACRSMLYKMSMDFLNNSSTVLALSDELSLSDGLNLLISAISN